MKEAFNLEETVKVYLKIRTAIEEMKDRHKQELSDLESKFEKVGDALLEFCNTQDLDSVKTKAGTISRRITSRYWTSDWESFYKVVAEHGAFNLLEQRIHNSNMKQFLEDNPEAIPPGLQSDRKYAVQVRRPTAK